MSIKVHGGIFGRNPTLNDVDATNVSVSSNIETSTASVSGNLQFNSGFGSAAVAYGCRAWVNFDGTTNTGGNCDIRDSGNVSSVADNSTGDYTVNLSTAMPDTNYAVVVGNGEITDYNSVSSTYATTSFKYLGDLAQSQAQPRDVEFAMAAVFR